MNTPTHKQSSSAELASFKVTLRFHGDLRFFVRRNADGVIERLLTERTSVKDAIEGCAVPHPEVDLILVNGRPIGFSHIIDGDAVVDAYPVHFDQATFFPKDRLQCTGIERFVADGHLGKLIRNLRLLGFDVFYDRAAEDRQLVELAAHESARALLTRDRRLLMHAAIQHGYFLRSQDALEQTIEVVRRFDLAGALKPFTRCLRCNAPLRAVAKADVLDSLEPLTKLYYERFRRCAGCGQIYWGGSHFDKLRARVEEIRSSCSPARIQ